MTIHFKTVSLSEERYFEIDNGERVRKQDIDKARGAIPFYSSSKFEGEVMGYVSDKIKEIVPNAKKFSGKFLTINADGSVGKVMLREGEFYLNDVVNILRILDKKILYEYLLYELQNKIDTLGYGNWSKKLYKTELKQEISVEIPIKENGEFDFEKQKEIAETYKKINLIKAKLKEDYERIINLNIEIMEEFREVLSSKKIGELFDFPKTNSKITKRFCNEHMGEIPVYASSKDESSTLGFIKDNLRNVKYYENCLSWNRNGSVGYVFIRNHRFATNEDHRALKIKEELAKEENLYLPFLKYEIEKRLFLSGFSFLDKCGVDKIEEVEIFVPIKENGEFDFEKQKEIAETYKKINLIKAKLKEDYERISNSKIQIVED